MTDRTSTDRTSTDPTPTGPTPTGPTPTGPTPTTDDARRAAGTATRREVLGDAHVDRSLAAVTPLTADFQDFITRVAWGDVWQRPGLDRRTRSMLTLAITAARGQWEEFALHVRGAVRNGLTDEEVAEVCLHTAVYAGVPAANHALAVARPLLAELRG